MIVEVIQWITIRIPRRIAFLISSILREASSKSHWKASQGSAADATEARQQADDLHQAAKDIDRAMHGHNDDCG